MIRPVILAGGSGTRLWPLSRELYPKQLINFVGDQTMLQETLHRLRGLDGIAPPLVICNESHRFMVAEQLRVMGIEPAAIILEPVGRNTAPAVAVAALRELDATADSVLLVLPADHHVGDPATFRTALAAGVHQAEAGHLVTFGVVPGAPETGYGYIRKGEPIFDPHGEDLSVYRIASFVEKPDLETARDYLASGAYCWNSGMFMFRASRFLEELATFAPEMGAACRRALDQGRADLDFFRLDAGAFGACPSDSVDYAVMEKTRHGIMVPFQAGWNDLGSWEALWQVGEKDPDRNVTCGDVLLHDVKNSFLRAEGRLLAAVGLDSHIVVETPDAVLISPRDRVQEVKRLVDRLKAGRRPEAVVHKKAYTPWGASETLVTADRFHVKRITVKPGASISRQKHYNRAEHWIVVRGTALVTREGERMLLREDESTYIPVGMVHHLENPGKIDLELIEVRTGSYLGEDDIVRFETPGPA